MNFFNKNLIFFRRSASHSQHLQRGAMSHRKISMPVGPTSTAESPAPKESLSQLSDLLEKSEKKSLFASRMPSSIEHGIQEENLRFLQNRDVFCEDYYTVNNDCNSFCILLILIARLKSVLRTVLYLVYE